MSKVLVDRELLERLMRADADMGREGSASFTLDASDRLDRAWAELRAILAQPEDPEGFEIARHSKRLVEQLRSDLSAVTAERDRLLAEVEALRKDAERYRWLRDPCSGAEHVIYYSRGDYGRGLMSGSMLDAAIDAAMAAKEA